MKLKHIVNIVLIVLLIVSIDRVKAEERTVTYLHTVSYHANRDANYNESNYGVGIRHYIDDQPYQYVNVGTYENSERHTSNYVGVGYQWQVGELNLGINAGIITGYSLGSVLPYVLPTINYKNVTLVFAAYPEAVVHLTVDTWRF